jgi:hypothetical protein
LVTVDRFPAAWYDSASARQIPVTLFNGPKILNRSTAAVGFHVEDYESTLKNDYNGTGRVFMAAPVFPADVGLNQPLTYDLAAVVPRDITLTLDEVRKIHSIKSELTFDGKLPPELSDEKGSESGK